MIKKVFILLLIVLGFIPALTFAQGAEARMRVSVEVLEGSSITMNQPSKVMLNADKATKLGMLTLKGIDKENVLISNSQSVKLYDGKGNEMMLNISINKNIEQNQGTISYEGTSSKEEMVSSVYRGQLTTTIEYF